MTTKLIYSILLLSVGFIACKKESVTQPKTTQEKIVGKWNWISEVTNDYYNGSAHITTYNFPSGDYIEFSSDGKVKENQGGSIMMYDYGIIDNSKIWLGFSNNIYELKLVTESDLQLSKNEVTGTDYYESTLNLKK